MAKRKGPGRPTVMTSEVLQKLEHGFSCGLTDKEACCYAGICEATLYNYCSSNPEFLERKELLKEQPKIKAKLVIYDALEEGRVKVAQWYLERKAKDEFSTKLETDVVSYQPVVIMEDVPRIEG